MRVLLVDDHALMREGLALLIRHVDPSVQVLHAANLAQALALLRDGEAPELVLLDLALPGVVGLEGLEALRREAEQVPVVVLSGNEDPDVMHACIEQGAMGYIPKSVDSGQMFQALRQVIDGHVYLPLRLAEGVEPAAAPATLLDALTPRQREVLALLVRGKPNKLIARELGITELTVKSHVTAVLEALGAANRTEAVFRVRHLQIKP